MHARTRFQSKLFVTPQMASHPTLAGERIIGNAPPLPRLGRRRRALPKHIPVPMARMPQPPAARNKIELSPGAWLLVCTAPAIAAVIFGGLLG